MCSVLDTVYKKGMGLSSTLWVFCLRLQSGRSTCGPCVVFTLLVQVVSTLM